jgi:plasmid stabilization system protein ParE
MQSEPHNLFFSRQALADIDAISTWYESQAAWQAAVDVPAKILDVVDDIAAHPHAGAIGVSGMRERAVSTAPFRIAYVIEPGARRVVIHAVVHTRRQWPVSPE